jgi:ligand-binding sensor domain-containing protein
MIFLRLPPANRILLSIASPVMAWLTVALATPETPQLVFEQISVPQGLSQSIVTNIMQDRRGYLWFGTEDGLNLYDGYGFTVLRTDAQDPNSLSYNQITALYEDRSGVIWVGTFNGGLNRYLLEENRFIRFRADFHNPSSLSHDLVYALVEDRNRTLWIGTDGGLNRMDSRPDEPGQAIFTRFVHEPGQAGSLADNHIRALAVDSTGNLWIGSDRGISLLPAGETGSSAPNFMPLPERDGDWYALTHDTVRTLLVDHTGALWIGAVHGLHRLRWGDGRHPELHSFYHRPADPCSLSNNHIWALLEDDAGNIWIGTDGGGINRYDPADNQFTSWRNNPHNANSLSHNEIRALFQDRSGLLWVGTYGGGVSKVDARPKRFTHYAYDPGHPEGLSQSIVWGIYEDPQGMLWIGTHGGGLNKLDRSSGRYTHYRAYPDRRDSLSHDIVRLVIPGHNGELWLGTNGGGICRFNPATGRFIRWMHEADNPRSLAHNEIRSLFLDDDGTLWIGTNGGGLDRLNTRGLDRTEPVFYHSRRNPADSTSIASDYIRFIHKDRQGHYWIGTQGGGLDRYDAAANRFIHHRQIPGRPGGLSSNYIFCMHEDSRGLFWLGSWGAGLIKFDPERKTFTSYSTRDGLPSDAIYGILEDKSGKLWFSSNNGLARFDPVTAECKNYSIRDGLQSNEFNGGSFFQSSHGEMFFGGINGFNAFFPDEIQDNPHIPPVVITSFRKMNREVRLDRPLSEVKKLKLSHRDYFFSFEFAALDYTAPEKNRYAYKMEGLDQEWITTSAHQRVAQYTTLPPGRYTFRVRGSNNDGVWNEEGRAIAITITPPFWQTRWFQILILLAAGGTGLYFYLRRLRLIRMTAELRAAHDMQMAIMPHEAPRVPGFDISGICIPANQVGGDFYDYAWVGSGEKEFGIMIGDVSGKAMRAAMLAVMANGIVHAEAAEGKNVAEAVTRSNRILYPKIDRQTFIALCLVSLELESRLMHFTNAGLNEPRLYSGGRWQLLQGNGSPYPIGVRKGHLYQEQKVQLHPGDILLLQSDGLQDAMNRAREFYGEERLMTFLQGLDGAGRSAREIRDAILADVRAFTGDVHHYDDMTVIVIKVLP